ncbi:MAG TPA: prenyltransferase/squalene oxidase repeat-containing protein [Planctomycetota bacterium]|nr:prenyltransferase/squalene oxidase repeat-containing protein [Planctomycetota bacterium]
MKPFAHLSSLGGARAAAALLVALAPAAAQEGRVERRDGHWSEAITLELRRAVDDGHRWLAEHQHADGSWHEHVGYKLNSNYEITDYNVPHVGVTALGLMSFLAGGHLPGRGRYGDNIQRGLEYVLGCVNETGFISDNNTRMYSHAFATLFLAEIYGMSRRNDVKVALQKAVNLICDSQNAQGGWRYRPFARESDMSITVCQVVALRAARNVGITVPVRHIDDAERYVRQSAVDAGSSRRLGRHVLGNEGGAFRYQLNSHSRATFPLTAAGVTTLFAAGRYNYDEEIIQRALDFMDAQMPIFNRTYAGHYFFYYGHYYAVQAYYIAGGERWREYFREMRDLLLAMQRRDGSWPCETGPGEAFSTAVATLILSIPFQYLPIFQR